MAQGPIAGATDYSHQSFDDISADLNNYVGFVERQIELVVDNIKKASKENYYEENVPYDFRAIIDYSLKYFETCKSEISDIVHDIKYEVKGHHIRRLQALAKTAREININIGQIWHRQYNNKDYGIDVFKYVERVYSDTRDTAGTLLDLSNIASRLNDFIGKTTKRMKNNPWSSGLFYLFVITVVIIGLGVLSNLVKWYVFPIIIIGGILILGIVGALQLKNDDKLKDETFLQLMVEAFKRLPLLKNKK